MSEESAYIVFMPSGRRGRFEVGTPVLQCARRLGVDLDSVCGGRGMCGRCQVLVSEGEFAKHDISSSQQCLSGVTEAEIKFAQWKGLKSGRRLSCNARLLRDGIIGVPPESQVHRQIVRKRAEVRAIEIDPVVKSYYVEVAKPDIHHPSGDFQRLEDALKREWDVELHDTDLYVLRRMQKALRDGDWKVTVAVRHSLDRYDEIVGLWPGLKERLYGLAIDIGTTTVSCQLVDLTSGEVLAIAGAMNPQIRFGEDLMSRVSYVMSQPDSVSEMAGVLRDCLNGLLWKPVLKRVSTKPILSRWYWSATL